MQSASDILLQLPAFLHSLALILVVAGTFEFCLGLVRATGAAIPANPWHRYGLWLVAGLACYLAAVAGSALSNGTP